jgi:hypothetical protein
MATRPRARRTYNLVQSARQVRVARRADWTRDAPHVACGLDEWVELLCNLHNAFCRTFGYLDGGDEDSFPL